jgi:thymidylate synthase
MNSVDKQYFELLNHLLKNGVKKGDRTGTGTISVFDYTMRFNMSEGFPLLTSKKMFTKGVIHELIWFLKGDTNIKFLVDNGCHIWDGDAYKNYCKNCVSNDFKIDEDGAMRLMTMEEFVLQIKRGDKVFINTWGDLGPIYGKQWRSWRVGKGIETTLKTDDGETIYEAGSMYIDQIQNLINDLKQNPDSRRLMVSAWNVGELDQMTLPPCHYGFQVYTQEMNSYERKMWWCSSFGKNISYAEDLEESELDSMNVPKRKLSLKWIQRSVDVFLGLPFNISSYGLLLHLLAKEVNMVPNELIFSGGDVHLYTNHIQQAKEQLKRQTFDLPTLELTNTSLDDLKYEDVKILNYQSDKVLKAELSN